LIFDLSTISRQQRAQDTYFRALSALRNLRQFREPSGLSLGGTTRPELSSSVHQNGTRYLPTSGVQYCRVLSAEASEFLLSGDDKRPSLVRSANQCMTRSEYSGWLTTYAWTEGQTISTLSLSSRAQWRAVSARDEARPIPRNLLGTAVWISSRIFPLRLYSRLHRSARFRCGQSLPSAELEA
jgi:hypothetical protein